MVRITADRGFRSFGALVVKVAVTGLDNVRGKCHLYRLLFHVFDVKVDT